MTRNQTQLAALVCAAAWSALAPPALSAEKPGFRGIGLLPGGTWSRAVDVSADGATVVGVAEVVLSEDIGSVVWSAEGGLRLLVPNATAPRSDRGDGVSADGRFVIGRRDIWPDTRGYRWSESEGFVDLGHLPSKFIITQPEAVSADGAIVVGGSMRGLTDGQLTFEAFRWTEGNGMVGLGALPGPCPYPFSYALGVSGDGTVIVGTSSAACMHGEDYAYPEPFRWTSETGMQPLGLLMPDHVYGEALAVSVNGNVIVGFSASADYSVGEVAFRWTAEEGMTGIGSLGRGTWWHRSHDLSADGGVIIGWWAHISKEGDSGSGAWIWTPSLGIRDFPQEVDDLCVSGRSGWTDLFLVAVSDDGLTFVGFAQNPQNQREGWVLRLPSPASLACEGDADRDLLVNFADVTAVLTNFGRVCRAGAGAPGDSDLDGEVAFADIVRVLEHFGEACE